jgi:hypothetical protein
LTLKNYFGETTGTFNLRTKTMEGYIDPEIVQEFIELNSFSGQSFSGLFSQRIYSCENRSILFSELKSINKNFDLKSPTVFWNGKSDFQDENLILSSVRRDLLRDVYFTEAIRPIEIISSKSYSEIGNPGFNYDVKKRIKDFYNSL